MIQFNLLPDVKQQYVKARRTKQLVILISLGCGAGALAIMLLMFLTVDVVQRATLSGLDKDMATNTKELKSVADLDKILTVQSQINTLNDLHTKKYVTSRLFGYIAQITPAQISIGQLSVDLNDGIDKISIDGEGPTLQDVNTYIDTLKSTKYQTDATGSTANDAFSSVVLASFSRTDGSAKYSITMNFNPDIFAGTNNVTLTVPHIVTDPQSKLFQQVGN